MFILRPQHEQAFGLAGLRRFNQWVVGYLMRKYPAPTKEMNAETLLVLVDEWMAECREAGFKTEKQMACYYAARLMLTKAKMWPLPVAQRNRFLNGPDGNATERGTELHDLATEIWRIFTSQKGA